MQEKNEDNKIVTFEDIDKLILKDFENKFKRKEMIEEIINHEKFIKSFYTEEREKSINNYKLIKEKEAHELFRTVWFQQYLRLKFKIHIEDCLLNSCSSEVKYISSIICFDEETKKFNIEDNIYNLLKNTKNKIDYREIPFPLIFINKQFIINNNIIIFGIGIYKGICIKNKKPSLFILLTGKDFNDDSIFYKHWNIVKDIGIEKRDSSFKSVFSKNIEKKIEEEISLFICNLLDFINHPDVELRVIKWFNNEKRIKYGKLPIIDKVIINIKGKLYKYIYEDLPRIQHKSPSFAFWVRGHYIHFRNKQIYRGLYSLSNEDLEKKGYYLDKQNIICKWIFPYIKNKELGKPKIKIYKIKDGTKLN